MCRAISSVVGRKFCYDQCHILGQAQSCGRQDRKGALKWSRGFERMLYILKGFAGSSDSKESAYKAGDLDWFLGQEDPLEKGMATHSSVLASQSHGQRSLVGYSPWGCKESDMTEHLTLSLYIKYKQTNYKKNPKVYFKKTAERYKRKGASQIYKAAACPSVYHRYTYYMRECKSLQCVQPCDPMDCSLPGSSVHEILQARILEWVAVPSSRGASPPRD